MKKLEPFGPAISLGTNIAAGFIFFAGIGYFLDYKFEQKDNLYTLVGIFCALGYSFYELWKTVKKINEKEKQ